MNWLAYNQFTSAEMASGFAQEILDDIDIADGYGEVGHLPDR